MERRTSRSRLVGVALALGLAVTASACGERDDTDPQSSPQSSPSTSSSTPSPEATPPAVPSCTTVWAAGEVFPDEYAGCMENATLVTTEPIVCETGQMVYRHKDRFYATNGAPVRETKGPLGDDPQYQKMYEACTA